MDIRELRISKGMTMAQVAERCGISEAAVSLLESGKRFPRPSTVKKLAEVYGMPMVQLYGCLTEEKPSGEETQPA